MGQLPNSGSETLTLAGNISHFLIEDNLLDDGQFIGIGLSGKLPSWYVDCCNPTLPVTGDTWPHQGIIRGNTVRNLRKGFGASDVGIYCDACRDVVIERNRVEGTAGYCYAISTEQDGFLISQIIARYNIGINCGTSIMAIGPATNTSDTSIHGDSEHLRVVHNSAVKTKANGPVLRPEMRSGRR